MEAVAIGEFPFSGECREAVEAYHRWKNRLLDLAVENPAEALFVVVTGAAWIFYQAEKDVNEEVRAYGDALHYISTCMSVGYARIYPLTQTGKLVATIVMTIGPSLTSWMLEGRLVRRTAERETSPEAREEAARARRRELEPVLARLDAILQELKAARAAQA